MFAVHITCVLHGQIIGYKCNKPVVANGFNTRTGRHQRNCTLCATERHNSKGILNIPRGHYKTHGVYTAM